MQEDYLLIIQLNGGSKRAFSVIYDKYVGIIYSYVNSILRDDLLAEDITQFSFMQLWKHRDRISSYRNLPAYLYVVARNAAYKEVKRQLRAAKYMNFAKEHYCDLVAINANYVDYGLIVKEIEKVMSLLPESRKKIFLLRTEQNMSIKEIAESLGISPKTVETQISRTMKVLKKALCGMGFLICFFLL